MRKDVGLVMAQLTGDTGFLSVCLDIATLLKAGVTDASMAEAVKAAEGVLEARQ